MTKLHEEQLAGTPGDVLAALASPPRGEFVLVVAADAGGAALNVTGDGTAFDLDAELDRALAGGASVANAARDLARRGLGSRAELYRRASDRRNAERGA